MYKYIYIKREERKETTQTHLLLLHIMYTNANNGVRSRSIEIVSKCKRRTHAYTVNFIFCHYAENIMAFFLFFKKKIDSLSPFKSKERMSTRLQTEQKRIAQRRRAEKRNICISICIAVLNIVISFNDEIEIFCGQHTHMTRTPTTIRRREKTHQNSFGWKEYFAAIGNSHSG